MHTNKVTDEKIVSGIKVKVIKKDIKNFHLNVLPPNGNVRVSVPIDTSDDAVHFFVASRINWIKKQINSFKEQERETIREYTENESHYFLGQRYLLKLLEDSKNYVEIEKKKYINLYVKDVSNIHLKQRTLEKFYRKELKKILDVYIPKYEGIVEEKVIKYKIRKMKTKWGSCNIETKSLNFNLNLAKKPVKSIQYIVIHELVHLKERNHNSMFVKLMDKYMPEWREERKRLNDMILSYENWHTGQML